MQENMCVDTEYSISCLKDHRVCGGFLRLIAMRKCDANKSC